MKKKEVFNKVTRLEERLENLHTIEDYSSFKADADELQRGINGITGIINLPLEIQRRITQLQHKLDTLRESKKSNKVKQKMKFLGAFDKISQPVNESELKPKNKNRGRGKSPQMGI